jgi:hypothetical protein
LSSFTFSLGVIDRLPRLLKRTFSLFSTPIRDMTELISTP